MVEKVRKKVPRRRGTFTNNSGGGLVVMAREIILIREARLHRQKRSFDILRRHGVKQRETRVEGAESFLWKDVLLILFPCSWMAVLWCLWCCCRLTSGLHSSWFWSTSFAGIPILPLSIPFLLYNPQLPDSPVRIKSHDETNCDTSSGGRKLL